MSSGSMEFNNSYDKRLRDIINGINQCMTESKCSQIMDSCIVVKNVNFNNDFRCFESEIEKLKTNIEGLNTNRNQNRFLKVEDECNQIIHGLDKMKTSGDLNRDKRRQMITELNAYSSQIREYSMEYLKQLLLRLKSDPKLREKVDHNLVEEMDEFIASNSSHTIKAIDDYRFQLENIIS